MRFLLRSISFLLLVAAVFAGILDTLTSVADSSLSLTSIATAWTVLDKASLAAFESHVAAWNLPAGIAYWFTWLLAQPAFGVALALSLLFWMVGYRKTPAAGRFAA